MEKGMKNSLYGKYASNQLDDEVPEGFHRTPFGLMPNSLFHPDNDYLKEDASREQIIEFVNATADDIEQLKDFIYNDEDPEGYSHYKLVKETAQRVFNLSLKLENYVEEYDAVLKTYGDTLEQHIEQIEINKGNIEDLDSRLVEIEWKTAAIYQFINSAAPGTFFKILEELKNMEIEKLHNGSNFCGNCTHANSIDGICTCELNKDIVDPDDSSCAKFEPPF